MSIAEFFLIIMLLPPSYLHGGVEKSVVLSRPNNAAEVHITKVRDAYVVKDGSTEKRIYLSVYNGNKGLLIKGDRGELRVDNYQDVLGLVVDKKDKRIHFYRLSEKELRQGKRSSTTNTTKGVMSLQGNEVVIQYRGVEERFLISAAETQQSEFGIVAKDGTSDQIRLKDESILTGVIKTDKVPFKSSFGKIEIIIDDVRSFADGKLSLADGTVLKGVFFKGELEIETSVGKLEVDASEIVGIARGEASGLRPGTTGGHFDQEAREAVMKKIHSKNRRDDPRNIIIHPTGPGKLTPFDKDRGIEERWCVNVQYEARHYNTREFMTHVESWVLDKTGNHWKDVSSGARQQVWDKVSCPGDMLLCHREECPPGGLLQSSGS